MSLTILVHVADEEAILCEVDEMPDVRDQAIIVHQPRRRDGRELHYLEPDVSLVVLPWHRINFVEVLPSAELEEVVGFVRE